MAQFHHRSAQGVGSENYYPVSAYMTDIASTSSGKVYLTGTIGSSSTGNEGSISQGGWANGYEIVTGSRDAFVFEVQNSSFDWIFGFESYDYNDYPEIRDLSVTTEGGDIVYNVAETNSGSGCVGASDDLIERCVIVRPSDGSSPSSTLIPLHENSMELAAGADGFFAADCKGPSKWVREYSVELTQLWEVNLSAYPENSTGSGSCQLMPMDDGGVLVAIGDYTNGIYLVSIDENGTVAEVYSDILDCFGAGYSAEYPLACQITAGHMFEPDGREGLRFYRSHVGQRHVASMSPGAPSSTTSAAEDPTPMVTGSTRGRNSARANGLVLERIQRLRLRRMQGLERRTMTTTTTGCPTV